MAVLDPNEIFFTAFEPKQANRFILYMDGVPSFMIKGTAAITLSQGPAIGDKTPMRNNITPANSSCPAESAGTFLKNCFPCGIPLVNFLVSRKNMFFSDHCPS